MPSKKIENKINFCNKCKHTWKQRGKKESACCPFCHSKDWKKKNISEFIRLLID
jgi:uncharacterized CHY-type Zn-finger protein